MKQYSIWRVGDDKPGTHKSVLEFKKLFISRKFIQYSVVGKCLECLIIKQDRKVIGLFACLLVYYKNKIKNFTLKLDKTNCREKKAQEKAPKTRDPLSCTSRNPIKSLIWKP